MSYSTTNDFENFVNALKPSLDDEELISQRYHSIVKRINKDYWDSDDDCKHGLYVGSHGRGTDIYTSDIDIVVSIPWRFYSKFNDYVDNKQSDFLQDVKKTLKKTYSTTDLKGDGQVIVISFSDGMKFEVVPAFEFDDGSFLYANTNNGGDWVSMNPRAEINEFNYMNAKCNNNLKKICKMAREWNKKNNVLLEGIVLDCMCYYFLKDYEYNQKSYLYYDWMSRDFFSYLKDIEKKKWKVPGGNWYVEPKFGHKNEAQKSYEDSLNAIDYAKNDFEYLCKGKWRNIYGSKF